MATGVSSSSSVATYRVGCDILSSAKKPISILPYSFSRLVNHNRNRKSLRKICLFMEKSKEDSIKVERNNFVETKNQITVSRLEESRARKKSERQTYLVAAIMSSLGISSMAVLAVYYRFSWQMEVRTNLFF